MGLASAPSTALAGMEEGFHLSGFLSSLKKKKMNIIMSTFWCYLMTKWHDSPTLWYIGFWLLFPSNWPPCDGPRTDSFFLRTLLPCVSAWLNPGVLQVVLEVGNSVLFLLGVLHHSTDWLPLLMHLSPPWWSSTASLYAFPYGSADWMASSLPVGDWSSSHFQDKKSLW